MKSAEREVVAAVREALLGLADLQGALAGLGPAEAAVRSSKALGACRLLAMACRELEDGDLGTALASVEDAADVAKG